MQSRRNKYQARAGQQSGRELPSTVRFGVRAFSLIELLCVIVIIGILASLVLGPAAKALSRVRAADWADKAEAKILRIEEQLKKMHGSRLAYPAMTPSELRDAGILNDELVSFLKSSRVDYFPFSSADSTNHVILIVRFPRSFFGGSYQQTLYKADLER